MQRSSSNNGGGGIVNEIVELTKANRGKRVKWKCGLENKLIVFTYYLKLFFTLIHTIKLFYQTYLVYLLT